MTESNDAAEQGMGALLFLFPASARLDMPEVSLLPIPIRPLLPLVDVRIILTLGKVFLLPSEPALPFPFTG